MARSILIVDDNAFIRKALCEMFKRKLPLIMYSTFGDRYVKQQASLLGISSIISKSEPVTAVVGAARSLITQTAA